MAMHPPETAPIQSERAILFTLASVQFTHVVDFMIMMPLGAELMRVFKLSPAQFSRLVAAYGVAAAVSGLIGGFFLDRVERRRALLVLYVGFILATLACAVAPNQGALLAARLAAGIFGGLVGSLVVACVGDIVPPERRGRGMAFVMSAFPAASIAGVPLGLALANRFSWHAPFFFLTLASLPVLFAIPRLLPRRPADPAVLLRSPTTQMASLLAEPIHWRGLAVTAALVAASGCLIPFLAPYLVANAGVTSTALPWVYFCGGLATLVTNQFLGRLTDRHDKVLVLTGITILAAGAVWFVTRLGPIPFWFLLPLTTLFFIGLSGRFPPATTLVFNAVAPKHRAGFSALNSSVQSACIALANLAGGAFIACDTASGRLLGYDKVAWLALSLFSLTLLFAHRLRIAAPHAARNPAPTSPLPTPTAFASD